MPSLADGLAALVAALDKLEIPYSIGGSVASSVHGMYRATNDVDLVVDMRPEQIEELAEELKTEFYADPAMMRDAFNRGRASNVIHYASAYKFDLFPLHRDEYSAVEFARRSYRLVPNADNMECAVGSAEDTLLRKLDWFRRGGETSGKQWADIQGIVDVKGSELDMVYLRRWAAHLRVSDLLDRLLARNE